MVIQGKKLILILRLLVIAGAILAIVAYLGKDTVRELLLPEGSEIYESIDGKYSVVVPQGWTVDASRVSFPIDAFIHESKNSFVYIDSYDDPALAADEGRFFLEQQIRKGFGENPNYTLENFEDTTWMGRRAFVMNGTRKDKEFIWNFRQYVVFSKNSGRTYNITASIQSDAPQELADETLEIIESIRLKK